MSPGAPWTAGPKSQRVLAELGRTEDVMFSPDGRRLAVAGFRVNRIAVFDIAVEHRPAYEATATAVRLTDVVELVALGLQEPHGLCFLDDDTLAVANRGGHIEILAVPRPWDVLPPAAAPRRTLAGAPGAQVRTPGSLAVRAIDAHTLELLVCNNYANTVTRHVLDRRQGFRAMHEATLLADQLATPDGICVSPDGCWIAVSNHDTHSVLLYERSAHRPGLNPRSTPDGVLRNVLCPHGVRFSPDMAHILVADAGAPFVNVYDRGGSGWQGVRDPARLFPAMDRALFVSGQHNPQEGGPKGLDIDERRGLLATTCETQALAFFELDEVLCRGQAPAGRRRRFLRWRIANALFNRLGYMARGAI